MQLIKNEELYITSDGSKLYKKNGKIHRDGGPAVEGATGHKEWWINNKLHRDDGPAVTYTHGGRLWYQQGVKASNISFK